MKKTVYTLIFSICFFVCSLPLAAQSIKDYDAKENAVVSSRSWIDVDYVVDKKSGTCWIFIYQWCNRTSIR
jgi:hypothetical protein